MWGSIGEIGALVTLVRGAQNDPPNVQEYVMSRSRPLAVALSLVLTSWQAMAADSHAEQAERLLELTRADRLPVPVYAQVQELFARGFAEAKAPAAKKAVLERYQARADAALDRAIGWDKLRPELVKLYAGAFSEQELKELIAFYQSDLGRKMLEKLPELNMRSAQITQARVEDVAPEVNSLLADMMAELKQQ